MLPEAVLGKRTGQEVPVPQRHLPLNTRRNAYPQI